MELDDDLKRKMTATVLAEADEGQEKDIAWIYYNHVHRHGEEGLNRSAAFKRKSDWFKVWMVILDDQTYAKDKPGKKSKIKTTTIGEFVKKNEYVRKHSIRRAQRLKAFVDGIFADASSNPYTGWLGQGNLDDFNREEAMWRQARQYYYLQQASSELPVYVKILRSNRSSVIFHVDGIQRYFRDHPKDLSSEVEKYAG